MSKVIRLLCLCCLFVLAACGGEADENAADDPTAAAQATADTIAASPLLQEVLAMETAWQAHGISDYNMEVRHTRPTWNVQVLQLTVEGGVVTGTEHDCFPARECILKDVEPETLTIEALFELAREVAPIVDQGVSITFHPTYQFPSTISYEEGFWSVRSFDPQE